MILSVINIHVITFQTYIQSKGSKNVLSLLPSVRKITAHPFALNYKANVKHRSEAQQKKLPCEIWWRSLLTKEIAECSER